MDNLVVGFVDLIDHTSAQLGGDSVQSLDLELSLDLVDGVAVGRVADAESVDSERTVAMLEGYIRVAVRVVVVRDVPVTVQLLVCAYRTRKTDYLRLVKSNTVGQDLDSRPNNIRMAILRRDLVLSSYRLISLEDGSRVVATLLGEVFGKGRYLEIALCGDFREDTEPSADPDWNGEFLAGSSLSKRPVDGVHHASGGRACQ